MDKNILAFLAAMGLVAGCSASDGSKLGPQEFQAGYQTDTTAYVLDVRTPGEYASGHIEGAVLLDVSDRPSFEAALAVLPKDKTYYIYCRSGHRSSQAAGMMKEAGLKVVELQGGMNAWGMAGMPVVK